MNSHPTLKAVSKYKNHPSIISIRCFRHQVANFNFSCIDKNTVLKEIGSLSTTKASQDTDLPVKNLKENADFFAEFICIQFNDSINSSKFPFSFKSANVTPIFKNESKTHKSNYRPVSPNSPKYFEYRHILKTFFQTSSIVSGKTSVPKTVSFSCLKNGNMLSTTKKSFKLFS